MDHWIISCNIKEYDVIGSFKVFQIIDWKQSANFNISDFIYIYISHPVKEIRYKCKVVQINLATRDLKDVIYTRSGNSYENEGRFMRIELVSVFSIPITSEELLKNGLTGRIQGPRRLNGALLDFVKNREAKYNIFSNNESKCNFRLESFNKVFLESENQSHTKQSNISENIKVKGDLRVINKLSQLVELSNFLKAWDGNQNSCIHTNNSKLKAYKSNGQDSDISIVILKILQKYDSYTFRNLLDIGMNLKYQQLSIEIFRLDNCIRVDAFFRSHKNVGSAEISGSGVIKVINKFSNQNVELVIKELFKYVDLSYLNSKELNTTFSREFNEIHVVDSLVETISHPVIKNYPEIRKVVNPTTVNRKKIEESESVSSCKGLRTKKEKIQEVLDFLEVE